jgi:hypothetical protein
MHINSKNMPFPFCRGLQLDPGFVSLEAEDDLEYSRVTKDKNLELWLLQIPIDVSFLPPCCLNRKTSPCFLPSKSKALNTYTLQFPLDEKVVWRATETGSARVSAICEIEGEREHRLKNIFQRP